MERCVCKYGGKKKWWIKNRVNIFIKYKKIEKEIKKLLFVDVMVDYLVNLKFLIEKLLELISEFDKMVGYKYW